MLKSVHRPAISSRKIVLRYFSCIESTLDERSSVPVWYGLNKTENNIQDKQQNRPIDSEKSAPLSDHIPDFSGLQRTMSILVSERYSLFFIWQNALYLAEFQ
ncbi:hypothetical Protein YC6258_04089 [Gynuella sunshinyii YC6258]|uniref:Uncharacterized protein n=1 Tax=Gynuella sunshinyii YC6258 TaxID=1445510 RepID=A0A0C5V9U3_9GAMM|nr:hypothetical Protein YC6258_04089 [Gynuella sunshinyii YC6258]